MARKKKKKQASINRPNRQPRGKITGGPKKQKLKAAPPGVNPAMWDPIKGKVKPSYADVQRAYEYGKTGPGPYQGNAGHPISEAYSRGYNETHTPAAPASQAPPPPPTPWDLQYSANEDLARRQREQADAEIAYNEGITKSRFGLEDTSDPYSRAALLESTYKKQQAQTQASFGAQGHLYSGGTQRALTLGTEGHNQNKAFLRQEYDDLLNQYANQRKQNQLGYEASVQDAANRQLEQNMADRPEPDYGAEPEAQAAAANKGKTKLPKDEYLRRLNAIRQRHGANSPEVQRFRQRNTY